MRDLIKGELIDIIEWLETSPDTMVWRFSRPDNEIKNGAQLIVRPGQQAVFEGFLQRYRGSQGRRKPRTEFCLDRSLLLRLVEQH